MRFFAVFLALVAMVSVSVAKDESQANDLVKLHLDSIGTHEARAAAKNQVAEGTVTFQVIHSAGRVNGRLQFVSEGDKFASALKLTNPTYRGEWFVSDGKKTFVDHMTPGVYSGLGQFVSEHTEILTEGLWGGALSTGWALAHLDERLAKLQDRGLKSVDSRKLHRVDYVPKKHSDLQIELYFDPDTLRHVLTVYSFTVGAGMAQSVSASAGQLDTHYRLEERFADFKNFDNLNLPGRWTIQFTVDAAGGSVSGPRGPTTKINQFEATEINILHNVSLDPKNFEVK
jgi:hypothetical protein